MNNFNLKKYLAEGILLKEFDKSKLNFIASKLNIKPDNEDYQKLMNALDSQGVKYLDLKQSIEKGEIQSFDDIRTLKTQSKSDIKKDIKKDVNVILNNENFLIIQPKTYESNCKYGSGTKWCTTTKGPEGKSYFNEHSHFALIFIIDKSKSPTDPLHKVAFTVEEYMSPDLKWIEYASTFYDLEDNPMSRGEEETYKTYLKNKGVDLNSILSPYTPKRKENI
jgi:hypothetical protein